MGGIDGNSTSFSSTSEGVSTAFGGGGDEGFITVDAKGFTGKSTSTVNDLVASAGESDDGKDVPTFDAVGLTRGLKNV